VIAFALAVALDGPVKKICRRINIERNIASLVVVILFFALAASACYGAFACLLSDRMIAIFVTVFDEAKSALLDGIFWVNSLEYSDTLIDHAKVFLGEMSSIAISKLSTVAASLPGIGVATLVTVIATIFFEMELPGITGFLRRVIPEKIMAGIESAYLSALPAVRGCARAYFILFAMTYVELAAGLFILGIPGAMFISFVIAVLDILPVLGTGTVLIPWCIIAFSTGRAAIGTGVLILYIIISVVRNIAEPKFVGKQIGLSPAVMLPCMLIGLKIMGIAGLIVFPFAVAVAVRVVCRRDVA
jgi:sporulation integral membrane protein YtvI